jgi:hypothetical protein
LLDLTGRVISTYSTDKDIKLYTLSTGSLSNGIYTVKIIGKEGSISKKIIKQ